MANTPSTPQHARRAFTGSPQEYENYARGIHETERDRVLSHTRKMPLQEQWPIHQGFLAHITEHARELLPEFARDIHETEGDRVLDTTEDMSLESQPERERRWQIHKEFLVHIERAVPQLLPEYARAIHNGERDRVLSHTRDMSLKQQWQMHQEFLKHIRRVSPALLPEFTQDVYDAERGRILYGARNRPEYKRWQWYQDFLVHIRDVAPKLLQANFQAIVGTERGRIRRNTQSLERQEQRLNKLRRYVAQVHQALEGIA